MTAPKKIQDLLKSHDALLKEFTEPFQPEVREPTEIDLSIKQKERTLQRLKSRIKHFEKEKEAQVDRYDSLLKSLQEDARLVEKNLAADLKALKKIQTAAKK